MPRIGWQQVNDSGSVLVSLGQDVVLLVDRKSFTTVTGSSLRSGIGWFLSKLKWLHYFLFVRC